VSCSPIPVKKVSFLVMSREKQQDRYIRSHDFDPICHVIKICDGSRFKCEKGDITMTLINSEAKE
jgi:hypothetical protein